MAKTAVVSGGFGKKTRQSSQLALSQRDSNEFFADFLIIKKFI